MGTLGMAAIVVGGIIFIISGLMLLIAAFRESVLWGLGCLFVPFCSVVFLCMHWAAVRGAFMTNLISAIVMVGGFAVVGSQFEDGIRTEASKREVAELTASIQEQRDRIERLEGQFATQGAEVTRQHQELTLRRAALKRGDEAALAQFNADAAAYQVKNQSQKTVKQELDLAREELSRMLGERSKLMAAAGPPASSKRVVMYSTKSCPACVAAKAYFARKGIDYDERDVQTSPAARQEFKNMGGRGVPLIIVGGERMEGFSETRLDQLL
jgi:glutaredoxin 3